MGLIRKLTSVSTVGLVDFRSDKERIARHSRQTRNAVNAQTQLMRQQASGQESVRWSELFTAGRAQRDEQLGQAQQCSAEAEAAYYRSLGARTGAGPAMPPYGTPAYEQWYAANYPEQYAAWRAAQQPRPFTV